MDEANGGDAYPACFPWFAMLHFKPLEEAWNWMTKLKF